ncbi:hypothetical protein B9G53_04455 [Pseudanabaena sp. SR411]|uniref:hypothetical protein n=1 Tax=Pseudanabaena sp. SR411 TaxID=1980935 RepID=UPI000B996A7B|nr:hypothetical protein [Pseudanabaena sp. SR411]OYQ66249.1 hypothetical protein B9G53_04455 [Pseudanabaena sp. SR411]
MKWKLSKLIGVLAIAMIVLFASTASANAPPPPPMNWFTFSYPVGQQTLQGLQIVECNTATCEQPRLFIQYGECRDTGCLNSSAIALQIDSSYRFNCSDNRCLLVSDLVNTFPIDRTKPQDNPNKWFRLIGQFSDRLRLSPTLLKDPKEKTASFPHSGVWQVQVTQDSLQVIQEENKLAYFILTPVQEYTSQMFLTGWLLTIASELLVGAIVLWWRKASQQNIFRVLMAIAMVNLFSYPVVWSFFPSLEPFQILLGRYFGISSLFVAMFYGLAMHVKRQASSKKIVFFSLLIFIGMNILGGFIALWFGYGNRIPIAEGIPYRFTLPVSEVFAVVYEAWLISTLSLGQLSLKQAGLLSLLTNITSLLLGFILFGVNFLA